MSLVVEMRKRSRKRKSKARKSCSRKRARRRPPSSSRLRKPSSRKPNSSDEEFVPDSDFDETEEEEEFSDSAADDEEEEEDDDTDDGLLVSEANAPLASSLSRRTSRPSRAHQAETLENGEIAGLKQEGAQAVKRKGKEKVLEGDEFREGGAGEVTCGICLTDKALEERGKLDCCDHFFCFGCIMEWAKVESRCPMCKQRFVTIAKSATTASKRSRTVRIPLRDQVYIPPEELDLPHDDPYADIVCMECHGTGDEGLLLLCDRCDSAAHTFCVGLGRSVPRGDWFCRECQALVAESSDNGSEEEELVLSSSGEEDSEDEGLLLRSIVASVDPNRQLTRQQRVQRTGTSARSLPVQTRRVVRRRLPHRVMGRRAVRMVPAPRPSEAARTLLAGASSESSQAVLVSQAAQSGSARTVPQQRRLQERIHAMRSNWVRLQTGDLQFNVLGTQSTPISQQAMAASTRSAMPPALPVGLHRSNSTALDQSETSIQGDRDIERAWRMMNQAQNLSGTTSSTRSQQQKSAPLPHRVPLGSGLAGVVGQSRGHDLPGLISRPVTASSAVAGTHMAQSFTPEAVSKVVHEQCSVRNERRSTAWSPSLTNGSGDRGEQGNPCSSSFVQRLPVGTSPLECSGHGGQVMQDSSHSLRAMQRLASPPLDCLKESNRPSMALCGNQEAGNVANGMGTENGEFEKSKPNRHSAQGTPTLKGSASTKVKGGVIHPSPSQEDLKVHLTELVKKQTWPIYLAEGLDKEQFKRIARASVHSLLASCDSNNGGATLLCGHVEEHGQGPITNCCRKCLDQHVGNAVKEAKERVLSTKISTPNGPLL